MTSREQTMLMIRMTLYGPYFKAHTLPPVGQRGIDFALNYCRLPRRLLVSNISSSFSYRAKGHSRLHQRDHYLGRRCHQYTISHAYQTLSGGSLQDGSTVSAGAKRLRLAQSDYGIPQGETLAAEADADLLLLEDCWLLSLVIHIPECIALV